MPISRSQMERQLRMGGGIMSVTPREKYGWGSSLKKFAKKVTSPVTKIAKKIVPKEIAGIMRVASPFLPPGYREAAYLLGTAKQTGRISPVDLALAAVPTFLEKTPMGQNLSNSFKMSRPGQFLLGQGVMTPGGREVATKGILGSGGKMFQFGKGVGLSAFADQTKLGKFIDNNKLPLGAAAISGLAGYMTQQGMSDEQIEEVKQNPEALKTYLREYYSALNPEAKPEEVEKFVQINTAEYRANGGRIGFADGMPEEGIETLLPKQKPSKMMQEVDSVTQSVDNFAQLIAQSGDPSSFRGHVDLLSEFIQKNDIDPSAAFDYVKRRVDEIKPGLSKFIFTTTEDMPVENKAYGGRIGYSGGTKDPDDLYTRSYKRVMELMDEGYDFGSAVKKYMEEEKERENKAYGGRIGYAFGNNPEQNAINAAGIMDLPLNQNPAGATELDLRDSGGFIPPVGVKEKADDIPAMLSNNEFVFTADAVRGMGDGDVNKGAQRMYDMMKKLEGGGRV